MLDFAANFGADDRLSAEKFPHAEVRRIFMGSGERDFVFGDIVKNPDLGAFFNA